jgi:hypothetical protein
VIPSGERACELIGPILAVRLHSAPIKLIAALDSEQEDKRQGEKTIQRPA